MTPTPGGDDDGLGYRVSYVRALEEIRTELRRLNDKQDGMRTDLHNVSTEMRAMTSVDDDLAARVRALELKYYGVIAGIIAAVALIVYQARIAA